jgi:hypothetical protein
MPPGQAFREQWSNGDCLDVFTSREYGSCKLQYRAGGRQMEQTVYIARKALFGPMKGHTAMFFCPECNRRCALLYLFDTRWSCRKCHDLRYQSELELKGQRGLRMARKIQWQLGGQQDQIVFPARPKGMHRRTYERLWRRHQASLAKSKLGFGLRFAQRPGLPFAR